jgi:hypothetical protein
VDHHHHIARTQAGPVGRMPVQHLVHHLQFHKMVARSHRAQAGIAEHGMALLQVGVGRVARAAREAVQADAGLQFPVQARLVRMGPQAFAVQPVQKGRWPVVEQGAEGGRGHGHIAPAAQQAGGQQFHQAALVGRQPVQPRARGQQAHAAVDIGAYGGRNDEVRWRGHHAAHRGHRARMEIGRGAGAADGAFAVMAPHGGKGQQLAHGLVLQRQAVGKEDMGLGLAIAHMVGAVAIVQRDARACKGTLKSLGSVHGCSGARPWRRSLRPVLHGR